MIGPSRRGQPRTATGPRLDSLLAVDEMVGALVDTLRKDRRAQQHRDRLHLRQRLPPRRAPRSATGKSPPYEPSIRVPLDDARPGHPQGRGRASSSSATSTSRRRSLDLADAGADRKPDGDGRSICRWSDDPAVFPGRGDRLENWCQRDGGDAATTRRPTRYRGVRTDRYAYMRYPNGEQELYDLERDPFELQSRHADPAYAGVRSRLSTLLGRLRDCDANVCRSRPALKLQTRFRRGPGGCVDGGVRTRVVGKQRKQADSARFFAGKRKAGRDLNRPLRRKVARKKLRGGGKTRIEAVVTMLDGRQTTISKSVPRKC